MKKIAFSIVTISPSLIILLAIDFTKSLHYGIYEESEFNIFDWMILIFAAAWQFLGIYGIILIDREIKN